MKRMLHPELIKFHWYAVSINSAVIDCATAKIVFAQRIIKAAKLSEEKKKGQISQHTGLGKAYPFTQKTWPHQMAW